MDAALPAVPAALRPAVEDWAQLLESGRTPADLVLETARRGGPLACLTDPELSLTTTAAESGCRRCRSSKLARERTLALTAFDEAELARQHSP